MTLVNFSPTLKPQFPSYVTKDLAWAAIPYGDKQYIVIHNGFQVHLARSFQTAKSFIQKQLRKSSN